MTNDLDMSLDKQYLYERSLYERIIFFLFKKPINTLIKTALGRAYERQEISSSEMHSVAAITDRMLNL